LIERTIFLRKKYFEKFLDLRKKHD